MNIIYIINMYNLEIYPSQIKNLRLRKELEKLENENENDYFINSIVSKCKHYTGISNNKCSNIDYSINISLNLYNYIDDYIDCELNYLNNYPFKQPSCKINGKDYREILYRMNRERYNDKINYGIILKKYINYGFKSCPCCDSIFYKNQNNFLLGITDYLDEIKKVILCKYNKEQLILSRNIMNNKIGIEFESVYEYLVGKI